MWAISILDENEEDWVLIMGEYADFTQEQVLVSRCQACGKWEICNDG